MTDTEVRKPFVGRAQELRELASYLDDSRAGRGRLVLLGGEPGIGKSRLADELADLAREGGHAVLWGRGWEDAGAPPYWPWVQILRAYLRTREPADVRRDVGSGGNDLAQILPELGQVVSDLGPAASSASESARFQLFDSAASLLRRAAKDHPMLLVIDDLQAADIPSLLLLRFLATQLADMALLVVGTYRDVELTPDHPLTAAIGELRREQATRVMALRGLPVDAVGELIAAGSSDSARDRIAGAVWRATSGNPLFVGEAVRLLSAEDRLEDLSERSSLRIAVPASVRAVIARRIGRLSEATVGLLRVGAVIGPEFGLDVLRRVSDATEPADLVDEAVDEGLLLRVPGALDRYRFSHDLVRETLYEDLPPGPRSQLHRRIGEAHEAMVGSRESHLAELAFHFVAAVRSDGAGLELGDAGLAGKAVDYARRAGDRAARSLAYEEAARLYRMSLEVLDLEGQPNDELRAEILLALGDVQARGSSIDDARASFLGAAELARRVGNGEQLARAALGVGGRLPWARPGKDTKLIPLLQDALVMLGGSDDRLRVLLLARLACAWRSSPERRSDSDALSRQAIEIARRIDDLGTLSYALSGRFWATWWPENPEERQTLAAEIVAIADELGDGERIIDAHLIRLLSLGELGRLAEAGLELSALARSIKELRQPAQLWLEPVNRAYLAVALGEFDLARQMIDRQLQADTYYTPGRDGLSAARMERFLVNREQGRVAEEEATVRASVDDFPWYPFHRAALTCLLVDVGRDREAQAIFDDLAKDDFRALYRDNEWLFGMGLASEACSLLGDAAAAAVLYEQLLPFAGRHAIAHAEGSVGAVDRYLGLLASTRGDVEAAVRHLRAAITVNEAFGTRPWVAHSQHDLAVILRRRRSPGDQAEADRLDGAAWATAVELGMVLAHEIGTVVPAASGSGAESGHISRATFRREGEYWTVEFGNAAFRLRDSKGMGYLARLLTSPGREIHSLELATVGHSIASGPSSAAQLDLHGDGLGSAGPILDAEAKAAYKARLTDIREELAEAERWNDPERAANLELEAHALAAELAGALGLGGRDRPAASAAERSRVSVTRAVRAAMARIRDQSAALGDHLEATIRTGSFCSYSPDPRAPIGWEI